MLLDGDVRYFDGNDMVGFNVGDIVCISDGDNI